jgi:hypothetical protein
MSFQLIYWIFLTACSAYALWKGGPPERLGISIAIAASFLSALVVSHDVQVRYQGVETGLFLVDLAALAAFAALALWADRFWPLWITGIHLVGVATHTAKLLSPDVVPRVYSWVQGLWAYPILLLIVIGAARHRIRVARFGADNSWIGFSGPSGRRKPGSGRIG